MSQFASVHVIGVIWRLAPETVLPKQHWMTTRDPTAAAVAAAAVVAMAMIPAPSQWQGIPSKAWGNDRRSIRYDQRPCPRRTFASLRPSCTFQTRNPDLPWAKYYYAIGPALRGITFHILKLGAFYPQQWSFPIPHTHLFFIPRSRKRNVNSRWNLLFWAAKWRHTHAEEEALTYLWAQARFQRLGWANFRKEEERSVTFADIENRTMVMPMPMPTPPG